MLMGRFKLGLGGPLRELPRKERDRLLRSISIRNVSRRRRGVFFSSGFESREGKM